MNIHLVQYLLSSVKKLWGWFCLFSWHFPTDIPSSSSWLLKKPLFFILYMDNLAGLNVFSSKPSHWCLFGMAAYHVWEKIGASKQENGVSVLWTNERLDFTVGNMPLTMSAVRIFSPELRLKFICCCISTNTLLYLNIHSTRAHSSIEGEVWINCP